MRYIGRGEKGQKRGGKAKGRGLAVQVASLFGVLSLRDQGFRQSMQENQNSLQRFSDNLRTMGSNLTSAGRQMTVVSVPIALGLGVAINASRNFSDSMANINAVLGFTGDESANLRQQLLEYGGNVRAGPQAVAEAYYDIVSGVADASTHMAILEAATRTSEAGQADLAATTAGLISIMNAYQFSAEDANYVSDVFTRTVGLGVLTMDELAASLPLVTGLSSSMGLELGDVAAQMAFLTTQGFDAGRSATFLRSMMTTLLNPTVDLSGAITGLGYSSGQSMIDALGLVGAYDAIKQFGGGAFDGLITNQEALQGAIALTKDGAASFFASFQTGVEGATENAREIQNQAGSWDLFKSKLDQLAITVGQGLAPARMGLMDNTLTPLIDEGVRWIGENPTLVGELLLFCGRSALLSPVLIVAGQLTTVVSGLIALLTSAAFPILAIGAAVLGVVAAVNQFNAELDKSTAVGKWGGQVLAQGPAANRYQTREQFNDAFFAELARQEGDFQARYLWGTANFHQALDTAWQNYEAGRGGAPGHAWPGPVVGGHTYTVRSEEHTSELQSQSNLV